ncbi:MAG: hypothetical protein MJE77_43670 [Proteobacteria bacterium]|nr:hypothetical protein [Pseudomonadota bacterium]
MDAARHSAGSTLQKLTIDKFTDRDVVCLKLDGWIDEDFDGKKLAHTIRARNLILHLSGVRRISSFGIREWVDFIAAASKSVEDIILVECSPKIVDQLNMVGNFIGRGRVFSFYVPYRCDYCDREDEILMQVDRDWAAITSMTPPERPCPNCGDTQYFDEDAITYFSYIASQPRFALEPAVTALLSSKLNGAQADIAQRLRVDKIIEDRFTYLKLSGDLDDGFPHIKLAEGLEGAIIIDLTDLGRIEPAGAAQWRTFIQLITPAAEIIVFLGVPPIFLEKLTSRDDIGPLGQVETLALPYACTKCATTAPHIVSVGGHYDLLKFATPPEMKCVECKSSCHCSAPDSVLSYLPGLPKPNLPQPVRKFIKSIKGRKPIQQRSAVTAATGELPVAAMRRRSWVMVVAAAIFAAVLTAGGLLGYRYLHNPGGRTASSTGVGKLVEASAPARPAWIASSAIFSGHCNSGAKLGMNCVGVSSHAVSEADAQEEAQAAALEAMVHALGPRIDHPDWSRYMAPMFTDIRQAKMSLLSEQNDRQSIHYDRAFGTVREGRKAVANTLRKGGGRVISTTPTAQYWERYESPYGGHRYLVFVEYQVTGDIIDKLIETYSRSARAAATKAMTIFPGIGWRYPDIDRGAVITSIGDGILKSMGLTEGYIVLSIQDRTVKDAPSFARILKQELKQLRRDGGDLHLEVKTGDNLPTEFHHPISRVKSAVQPSSTQHNKSTVRGPVNTWDRVGGNSSDGKASNTPK